MATLAAAPATAPVIASTTAPTTTIAYDAAIAAAIERLGDADPATRAEATCELWASGKSAEPALLRAARGGHAEVSARANAILEHRRLGVSPDAPPAVLDTLRQYHDLGVEERQAAARALSDAGDPSLHRVRALLTLYATERNAQVRAAIRQMIGPTHADEAVRVALIWEDRELVETLLKSANGNPWGDLGAWDHAAYLLLHDRLGAAIKDAEGSAAGKGSDVWLTALYRANGDLSAALAAAERSGEE